MLDPNKHGVYNKEGYMSNGKLKQLTYVGLITGTIGIWYSIFTNGFFITTTWLIIVTAIIGIILKLKENR